MGWVTACNCSSLSNIIYKSGVYAIVNTLNGKRYIGSALEFWDRWQGHIYALRGNHHNRRLTNSWRKWGESAFRFEVLLVCAPSDMLFYEQLFLDHFQSYGQHGYNVSPTAGNCLGVKHTAETRAKVAAAGRKRKGIPLSEAHRASLRGPRGKLEKVRLSKLGPKNPNYGKPWSAERKRKSSLTQKGKSRGPQSPEVIKRRSAGLKKHYAEKGVTLQQREQLDRARATRIYGPASEITKQRMREAHARRKSKRSS